MRINVINTQET